MGANGEGKKIPNFLEPGTDGTRGRGGRARMEDEGTHPLPLHVWGRERGHGTLRAPSGASFHSHGVSQSAEEWLAFGVVEEKLRLRSCRRRLGQFGIETFKPCLITQGIDRDLQRKK